MVCSRWQYVVFMVSLRCTHGVFICALTVSLWCPCLCRYGIVVVCFLWLLSLCCSYVVLMVSLSEPVWYPYGVLICARMVPRVPLGCP